MRAATGKLLGAYSSSIAQYHTELFELPLDLISICCRFDLEVSIKIAICIGLHAVKQSPPIYGEFQARLNSTDPQHNPSYYEERDDGTDVESKIWFSEGSKVVSGKCRTGVYMGEFDAKRRL